MDYAIDNFIIHPDYNDVTLENDIAIIVLRETLMYNPGVGIVCLPIGYQLTSKS